MHAVPVVSVCCPVMGAPLPRAHAGYGHPSGHPGCPDPKALPLLSWAGVPGSSRCPPSLPRPTATRHALVCQACFGVCFLGDRIHHTLSPCYFVAPSAAFCVMSLDLLSWSSKLISFDNFLFHCYTHSNFLNVLNHLLVAILYSALNFHICNLCLPDSATCYISLFQLLGYYLFSCVLNNFSLCSLEL